MAIYTMEKNRCINQNKTEFLSVKCVICSHMVEYGVIYDKLTNDEVNICIFLCFVFLSK